MTLLDVGLTITPARRHFKLVAGQNNHFLITLLVGLDNVRTGAAKLSPEFSTSWSPSDLESTYHRSRQYALESALVWITDLLDGYRRSMTHLPGLFTEQDAKRIDQVDGRARKLRELARRLVLEQTDAELLVQVGYVWRNRVVHSDGSSGRVPADVRARLERARDRISANFRGLEVDEYLDRVGGGGVPSFKDAASAIAATHQLVQAIDQAVIEQIDVDVYAESLITAFLSERFVTNPAVFAQFWPGNSVKTSSKVRQLLLQRGMTLVSRRERALSQSWIDEVCSLRARDARERFAPRLPDDRK